MEPYRAESLILWGLRQVVDELFVEVALFGGPTYARHLIAILITLMIKMLILVFGLH